MIKNIIIFILLVIILSQCTSKGTQAKPSLGGIGKALNCMFQPNDEWCIKERERQKEEEKEWK